MIFEGKELPDTYKSYSTQQLLDMWEAIQGDGIAAGTPVEKISAMRGLLWDYRLSAKAQLTDEMEEEERQRVENSTKENSEK